MKGGIMDNTAPTKSPYIKSGDIEIYVSIEGQPDSLMQILKVPGNAKIQIVAPNALLIGYQTDMPVAPSERSISIVQTD